MIYNLFQFHYICKPQILQPKNYDGADKISQCPERSKGRHSRQENGDLAGVKQALLPLFFHQ